VLCYSPVCTCSKRVCMVFWDVMLYCWASSSWCVPMFLDCLALKVKELQSKSTSPVTQGRTSETTFVNNMAVSLKPRCVVFLCWVFFCVNAGLKEFSFLPLLLLYCLRHVWTLPPYFTSGLTNILPVVFEVLMAVSILNILYFSDIIHMGCIS
jgi:hypothetical protein